MFKKLTEFFQSSAARAKLEVDSTGAATDEDLIVAAAVLLVEMAGSDGHVAPSEGVTITTLLSQHFSIDSAEIGQIVDAAIAARQQEEKIDTFVRCINERFRPVQRQKLLAMLWKIILADGRIDKYEQRLATQMKCRFQLTDEQAAEARQMAEQGKV